MSKIAPWLALAMLALGASACGPLVQIGAGTPPPDALMTLALERPVPAAASASVGVERAVSVAPPAVPAALQTVRVPVRVDDTSLQYVVGAQWSEQPARLFQQLLAEELRADGHAVLDPRASGLAGLRRVSGRLEEFGVDNRGPRPVARVRFEAVLVEPAGLRQARFVHEVPLDRIDATTVGPALNRAANLVARDVAAWLGAPPAAARPGAPGAAG